MHSDKHDETMSQNANHDQGHPPQYTGPNPEYFKFDASELYNYLTLVTSDHTVTMGHVIDAFEQHFHELPKLVKNELLVETATPISPETDTYAPPTRDPVTAFITGYINYYVSRGESPPLDNQSQSFHDAFTIPALAPLIIAAYETGRRSGSALRHFTGWVRNRFSRSGTDTPAHTLSTDTNDE